MQKGESDKIVQYSASVGYRVDYTFMLQNLVRTNPQGALEFAKKLGDAPCLLPLVLRPSFFRLTDRLSI